MMYFTRLTIDLARGDIRKLAQQLCNDGYHEHQQLWNLFSPDPDAQRDFLFRREQQQGLPVYYVVSQRPPQKPSEIWLIESKDYHPKLTHGQKLLFKLRANPVVTRADENGRKQRHDVVMDLKKQLEKAAQEKSGVLGANELVYRAGQQWLQKRADEAGFELSGALQIDGYNQFRILKPRQEKPIRYSTVEYEGLLQVSDVERFTNMLFNGLGRSKAFGCGLMLVQPV